MSFIYAKKKQIIIEALLKELSEDNLAVFAGAGLSAPAGYVSWSELLRPIAAELDLEIEKETDLVALAQYHCNMNQANRGRLNQLLIDELSANAESTQNHHVIARLPISTFWTTNYDKLIENSLVEAGKLPDVKYRVKQLSFTKRGRDAVVYKMHGDIDHPDEAVLTKDDYEFYHVKMQPFITALSGDLVSKTFLFLGFSFSDPNLDYILSRVRVAYTKDQRQHYCIQKLVSAQKGESQADTEYRQRKQELFIQDLLRFGIKTILVSDYSEITDLLLSLELAYRRKSIFISGAAHEYGRWGKDEAEVFIYKLAKNLSARNFRVVSGFGLGVGSSVITGVLENVYMSGHKLDSEQLTLRPFPQIEVGERSRDEIWNDYRNDMISHAGIAIFLFGNKFVDNEVVISDGLIKEFDIAREKGLVLLPLGATGFASAFLYKRLVEEGYFESSVIPEGLQEEVRIIGSEDSDLESIQQSLLKIIDVLR